jgi:hypothetical protein
MFWGRVPIQAAVDYRSLFLKMADVEITGYFAPHANVLVSNATHRRFRAQAIVVGLGHCAEAWLFMRAITQSGLGQEARMGDYDHG